MQTEEWTAYVNGVLRETKERDRQLLGGYRPEPVLQPQMQMLGGFSGSMLDPADTGAIHARPLSLSREGAEENEDDGPASPLTASLTGEGFPTEGAVASDQLARFLVQQIVSDLPDRFLGTESSDEEDDNEDGDRAREGGVADTNPPASWLRWVEMACLALTFLLRRLPLFELVPTLTHSHNPPLVALKVSSTATTFDSISARPSTPMLPFQMCTR